MQIIDTYSKLRDSLSLEHAHPVFRDWNYTRTEMIEWLKKNSTQKMRDTAQSYLYEVQEIVMRIETFFGTPLPGELVLIPSMGEIDGFARYDHGHHTVMLGIDFPEASLEYLRALTAHELSHVYRDHCPDVWGFLGKPLKEVSREEYLQATSGREHLVSEGLATLTSQAIYPEVPIHDHHYYSIDEMNWCFANDAKIHKALKECLQTPDPDPWKFYGTNLIGKGAPSRTHYYWTASRIDFWIQNTKGMSLLKAHTLPFNQINAF